VSAFHPEQILSIRRIDVDIEKRRIFIRRAKAGAREQPMTAELATFLKEHIAALPKGTEWVFPSVGSRSGHLATIRKAHRRVVKAAGLDPDVVVRHTFRHTAVTHLVQAGVDLPTVQKTSAHKTCPWWPGMHTPTAFISIRLDKLQTRMIAEKVVSITPKLHKAGSAP
jgi:integrase